MSEALDPQVAAIPNDHSEVAAISLDDFVGRYPVDPSLMLRLLYLCDNKTATAMILWDALKQHQKLGKLDAWLPQSISDYLNRYVNVTVGSIQRGVSELSERGLIEIYPSAPNTKRRIRLNLTALFNELEQMRSVFKSCAGLED